MERLLHIYNPDSDYALAANNQNYTPPRRVADLRRKMALFPLSYAGPKDALLVIDDIPLPDRTDIPIFRIGSPDCLKKGDWSEYKASPWGWNRNIASLLRRHCPGLQGIPSENQIAYIRELSHRRTTIPMLAHMAMPGIDFPLEFLDPDEAISFYNKERNLFLKAPWSSSGRGVMRTDDLEPKHVEPWIRGVIARQGSVMAEPIYDKILDCATEWEMLDGDARFLGVSVFETSRRGKYHGNVTAIQSELWDMIGVLTEDVIENQREALTRVADHRYNGPLGIDMLVTREGLLHPCVEINFRNTMGSILIDRNDRSLLQRLHHTIETE